MSLYIYPTQSRGLFTLRRKSPPVGEWISEWWGQALALQHQHTAVAAEAEITTYARISRSCNLERQQKPTRISVTRTNMHKFQYVSFLSIPYWPPAPYYYVQLSMSTQRLTVNPRHSFLVNFSGCIPSSGQRFVPCHKHVQMYSRVNWLRLLRTYSACSVCSRLFLSSSTSSEATAARIYLAQKWPVSYYYSPTWVRITIWLVGRT